MKVKKKIIRACDECSEGIEIPEELLRQLFDSEELESDTAMQLDSDLMADRMIFMDDMVDKNIMKIAKAILYWNEEDKELPTEERKPIRFYICSPGGDMNFMWMLVDIMLTSKTPIYTINIGVAHSAAALIFLGGSKRFMMKHSSLMIHQGSAALNGDYAKLQNIFKNYSEQVSQMYDYMKERCSLNDEAIAKHMQDDWFLCPQECLANGICHKIITYLEDIK